MVGAEQGWIRGRVGGGGGRGRRERVVGTEQGEGESC